MTILQSVSGVRELKSHKIAILSRSMRSVDRGLPSGFTKVSAPTIVPVDDGPQTPGRSQSTPVF